MIYVASDLHGYSLDKFKALLRSAGFSDDDYLFILGDVIDRGEEGIDILEWLMLMPNAELILGNHEAMMLSCSFLLDEITDESLSVLDGDKLRLYSAWQRNGCYPTVNALRQRTPEARRDILEYLSSCPIYDTVEAGGRDYLLVHAGLGDYRDGKKLSEYTDHELIWTRPAIYDSYSDKFTTVFGHTPTGYYGDRFKGKILKTKTWINVDCGVAYGCAPGLLRLDDLREFY